mmetsp:Transcript_8054/g.17491  ORF Transcript_8054/g.17491 Transcript_8054/m.17491 type:complete len:202 (+) Transcript_8054:1060-1665(+)
MFAKPSPSSSLRATIWYPSFIANFFAPANDERKTTMATKADPVSISFANCKSLTLCTGETKSGKPDGTLPTTEMPRSLKRSHMMQDVVRRNSSLKSQRGFRNLYFLSFFTFIRKTNPVRLSTNVGTCICWNSSLWDMRIFERGLSWQPIISPNWDSMISNALAVMNPLNAGRERKRTRKASRSRPISARIQPTLKDMMAAA